MAGSKRAAAEDYFDDNVEKKVRTTNDPDVTQKPSTSSATSGFKATASRQFSFPIPQDRPNQVDNPYGRRESLDRGAAQRDRDKTSGHNSPAQLIIPRRGETDKTGGGHGSGTNSPSVSRNGSVFSNSIDHSPVEGFSRTNGTEKNCATVTPSVTNTPTWQRKSSSGLSTPLTHSTTPQVPITPMSPTKAPSQQSNQLASALGEFTNLLMSMASTSTKREQAVKHLEQLQGEIVQGARFFAGFHSLSEQKNNAVARAQKRVNELSEKMEQYKEAHKNLVIALATGVAAGTNTDNSATDALHRSVVAKLQAKDTEIHNLKARLKGLEDKQNTLSENMKESAFKHSSVEKNMHQMDKAFVRDRRRLENLEKDLKQDKEQTEALQDGQRNRRLEDVEDRIDRRKSDHERLDRRVAVLSDDLSKLSSQVHDNAVAKSNVDVSKLKVEQASLKRMVDEHNKILQGLKNTANELNQVLDKQGKTDRLLSNVFTATEKLKLDVWGEGSPNPGLVADVNTLKQTMEKTAGGLKKLETAIREHESMIDGLRDRIQATRARSSSVTVVTQPATGEVVADMEAMRRDVEELKDNLGHIREEQDRKDEILAEESQELRRNTEALIAGPAKEISELKQHLHALSENVLILQRRSSEVAHSTPAQPATAELLGRFDAVSKQLHLMAQQVNGLSRALHTLEERYNNIMTDDLVRRMVHQMQMMYPEPARFQNAIDRTKVMDQQLRGRMGKIEAGYETCNASANTALSVAKKADEKAGTALVKVDKLEEMQGLTADEVRRLKDVYDHHAATQESKNAAVDAKIGSISNEVAELSVKVDKVDVRTEQLGKEFEKLGEEADKTKGQILGAIDILVEHNGLEPFDWVVQQDE